MIAAETTRTAAIIFPCRHVREHNVAHGTPFGTQPAVGTHVDIHRELLVRYHVTIEISSNDMTESPRCQAERQLAVTTLPILHHLYIAFKVVPCLFFLFAFPFWRVGVHKRQADIALGHDKRLAALQYDALGRQFFSQHRHGQSCTVAACAQDIGIMVVERASLGVKCKPLHKLPDDVWRLPAMHRETKPNTFVILKGVFTRRLQFFGNEEQPFLRSRCQLFSRPPRIACTRKIENHVAKVMKKSRTTIMSGINSLTIDLH